MAREARDYDFSVIRDLRNDQKVTLEKLAEATGVSFSTLARIESNSNQPNLATLKKLADFFGMTPANLLDLATAYIVEEVVEGKDPLSPTRRKRVDLAGISLTFGHGKAGETVTKTHRHELEYQVSWVVTGCIEINIHGKKFELKKGQAIKFDAEFEHEVKCLEDTSYIVAVFPKRTR